MATESLIQPVQLLLSFIFVIGLIFACAWLMRRTNGSRFLMNRQLKVTGSLSLGVKEKIVIVEVGQEQLVLGVCSQSINLLKTLDKPLEQADAAPMDFSDKLLNFVKRSSLEANKSDTNINKQDDSD